MTFNTETPGYKSYSLFQGQRKCISIYIYLLQNLPPLSSQPEEHLPFIQILLTGGVTKIQYISTNIELALH